MKCFEAFTRLRAEPTNPHHLEVFLAEVNACFERWSAKWPAEDERHQRALLKVYRGWARCRADTERRLFAWLRTVWRRAYTRRVGPRALPLDVVPELPDPRGPDETLMRDGLRRALDGLMERASQLSLVDLPLRLRNQARRLRVATTPFGRRRDLSLLLALRSDGHSARELARRRGVSTHVVKQAARRAAAWLRVVARFLAMEEGSDVWLQEGLQLIAELPAGHR